MKATIKFLVLFSVILFQGITLDAAVKENLDESPVAGKWSVNVGPGSQAAWNWAGISRNFLINRNFAFFLTAGVGTILFGGGISWYHDYCRSGPVVSGTVGIAGGHANVGYQFRYDDSSYLQIGAGYGSYFMQFNGVMPYAAYEYRF